MSSLWEPVINPINLRNAWEKVRANRGAAGADRISLEEFEADLENELDELQSLLLNEEYEFSPLIKISLSRDKERAIVIPTVRDRIV